VRLGPASLTISVLSTGAADFVSSMHGGPSLASSLFLRRARLGLRAMRAVRNNQSTSARPTAWLGWSDSNCGIRRDRSPLVLPGNLSRFGRNGAPETFRV
jgi:hypothetical protein